MSEVEVIAQVENRDLGAREPLSWGKSVCVDLYQCDAQAIRDAVGIRRYVAELVELIHMKAYGPCHVVHFGQEDRVAGYSMFQFIETSCISGHFANLTNAAYIDIFSCKVFDVEVATEFSQHYFGAQDVRVQSNQRF